MNAILIGLLSMCFGNDVCEYQMRDCMTPYIRHYEGKELYSSIHFEIFRKCYWGEYIPQNHMPGDKKPFPYHKNNGGKDD